jgi:hypothetical protein
MLSEFFSMSSSKGWRVKKSFSEADPRDWQNICAVYDNQE